MHLLGTLFLPELKLYNKTKLHNKTVWSLWKVKFLTSCKKEKMPLTQGLNYRSACDVDTSALFPFMPRLHNEANMKQTRSTRRARVY